MTSQLYGDVMIKAYVTEPMTSKIFLLNGPITDTIRKPVGPITDTLRKSCGLTLLSGLPRSFGKNQNESTDVRCEYY